MAVSVFFSVLVIQRLSKAGYCSEWWMAVPPIAAVGVLVWGVTRIHSQMFVPAICRFKPQGKQVMITFDDGPDPVRTPQILNLLDKYEAKAIFFLIGKKAEAHPEIAAMITKKGHEVGSHSYRHGYTFDLLSVAKVKEDLALAEKAIKRATGSKVRWFRPPYGITNPNIAEALEFFPYQVLGWNIRSLDTVIRDPKKLTARVLKKLKPGSIILFHDQGPATPEALENLLRFLKENSYQTILPRTENA